MLESDNLPRSDWLLARIMNAFPGRGNIVGIVEIKTPNVALAKPVGKVFLLKKMY